MASLKKKHVGKDDLRRLMKEKRTGSSTNKSKIDSPFAKYNNLGQLYCSLCNAPIKSDILWKAHSMGRTHKEKIASLQAKQAALNKPTSVVTTSGATALKRKAAASSDDNGTEKRSKVSSSQDSTSVAGLPADFFDSSSSSQVAPSTSKASGLQLGDYGSSDEDEEEEEEEDTPTSSTAASASVPAGLPADFFDGDVNPSAEEEPEPAKPANMAEALPEGFFDDPKMDAKVRNVEYRDKLEDEWESFQKAMKTEQHVSEAIIEEEEEQVTAEREIDEIDDQYHRWSKVNSLAKQKEALMEEKKLESMDTEENDSDLDEADYEEFLDWRSKAAWTQ